MRKLWILSVVGIILFLLVFSIPYLFSFSPFKQMVEKKLEEKVGGSASIDNIKFCWFGPQKLEGIHIATPEIVGTIDELSSNVPFWSINSFASKIEKINGSGTTVMDGETGKFSIEAAILSPSEINVRFSATHMSTAAFIHILKANNSLISAIGPKFDANGTATYKNDAGQFDIDFSSPKTQGSIKGLFNPESITLREPTTLAFYLTPELTGSLTKGALQIQSKGPARLQIASEGFYFPRNFSFAKMRIEQANLDLGKVTLQHANLTALAKMLRADSLTAGEIEMWLTNVDFSLKQGLFEMGRVDALLADSIHLCAWGSADLTNDKLNITFGIPADTLSTSLRIKNVSSNYVLQIPVTGSLSNPNIDAGSATAKIALMLASGQVQKQGGILGGVANVIGKASEEKAPPPKRPFPWD